MVKGLLAWSFARTDFDVNVHLHSKELHKNKSESGQKLHFNLQANSEIPDSHVFAEHLIKYIDYVNLNLLKWPSSKKKKKPRSVEEALINSPGCNFPLRDIYVIWMFSIWLWLHLGVQRLWTAKIKNKQKKKNLYLKYLTSVRRISLIWSRIMWWCFRKSSASSVDLVCKNVRFLWSSSANSAYLSSCTAHGENHQTSSAFCKWLKMIIQQIFPIFVMFCRRGFLSSLITPTSIGSWNEYCTLLLGTLAESSGDSLFKKIILRGTWMEAISSSQWFLQWPL